MVGPPSYCPTCGNLFESCLINIGPNVTGITFQNVGVQCPRCGAMARIADGTYDSVSDTLELVSGPSSSRAIIEKLRELAAKSRRENLTAKEIINEIAGISPEFALKIEQGRNWPAIGLILILIWVVKSVSLDIRIDFNWLIDQAWHIAHGEDPASHLESDAPPPFPYDPPHRAPQLPIDQVTIASAQYPNRHARRAAVARKRKPKKPSPS